MLPLFPLRTVLFPGMPLRINIFEPRYHELVQDCQATDQKFGVTLIRSGTEALGPLAEPYRVGCSAHIIRVDTQSNGQMTLTAIGLERFVIRKLDYSRAYLVGEVEELPLLQPGRLDDPELWSGLEDWLNAYLKLLNRMGVDRVDLSQFGLPEDPLLRTYMAAALLQVPVVEKQALLSLPSAFDLFNHVQRLYKREMAVLVNMGKYDEKQVQKLARLN
jgi:Lon protease-like protein